MCGFINGGLMTSFFLVNSYCMFVGTEIKILKELTSIWS